MAKPSRTGNVVRCTLLLRSSWESANDMDANELKPAGWSTDLQRVALWVVIASVAAAALTGVSALLVGNFADTQGRILRTTFVVLGASFLVMASLPAVSRNWLTPLPEISMGLAALGFGFLSLLIWADHPPEGLIKLSMILIIWSVAIADASLLSAARLKPAYSWVLWAAYASSAVLASTLTVAVVNEFDSGDGIRRLVEIVAIAFASSSIAVPVFHRMGGLDSIPEESGVIAPVPSQFSFCPSCGSSVTPRGPGETIDCPGCDAQTIVRLAPDVPAPAKPQTGGRP